MLYVDEATPWRALIDVMFTLHQVGIARLILATDAKQPPPAGSVWGWEPTSPGTGPRAAFQVFIFSTGFGISVLGSGVGRGCVLDELGPALPNVNGAPDYAGLSRCIRSLRESSNFTPHVIGADPSWANLAAAPDTPYAKIIEVIQALHHAGVENFRFRVED